MAIKVVWLSLVLCLLIRFDVVVGETDSQDVAALRSMLDNWQNAPPSWGTSDDPCGTPWEGVFCANSRVTTLRLSTSGIKGTLGGDIALLTSLQSVDLSYNKDLGGALTPNIGNLKQLKTLILAGCSFSGTIPEELGSLPLLTYVALNSNKFSGGMPASLGNLSKLYWLDVADNQLSGPLPVSSDTSPGLDLLVKTKHFHFNKNKFSGTIPEKMFNSDMTLLHILFDANQLTGTIPNSVGLVKTLEVLRLDRNQFSGPIPPSINNLTRVNEMILANNKLNGTIPDLSGMSRLNYLDLSNNSFDASETPSWFTEIPALTTLAIESGGLRGELPKELFGASQLQQVLLKNNSFNGTLDISGPISSQLQLVDLKDNAISFLTSGSGNKITLVLVGNPICDNPSPGTRYCLLQQQMANAYSTSLTKCNSKSCSQDQGVNPSNCACAYPYQGEMIFRAPTFSDLSNSSRFQSLERSMRMGLGLAPDSVSLQNIFFNSDNYLDIKVSLFPPEGMNFNRTEIQRLGFFLSNQTYKPPNEFGPYFFIGSPYTFQGASVASGKMSTGVIVGITVSCVVLFIGLILVGIYAIHMRKKAKKATELSRPFASWVPSGDDDGSAPQLKGARWFYLNELKNCTSNFSGSKEIGAGGYGKVYKGTLPNGQVVAIKRAQQGSMQGAHEFKTEIELLSRLHHKNLVGLVGFCYDQGEQMLVYEYVPRGTLRENLAGDTATPLDWKKRVQIALGSARGLAYLHELADPPIIHRDIKSSNILLDEDLTAKVADFGLSKLISDGEKGHVSTQVKGTLGYLDPEYYMTQQLTDKSDVYSFGVVMLELITARLPIEKGKYIVREIRMALDSSDKDYYGLSQIMDPVIQGMPNLIGFRKFVELAMQCVEESSDGRPKMNEIVKEFEAILKDDDSNPVSSSSFSSGFGKRQGASQNLYSSSQLPMKDTSDAFDSSALGFAPLMTLEPK